MLGDSVTSGELLLKATTWCGKWAPTMFVPPASFHMAEQLSELLGR